MLGLQYSGKKYLNCMVDQLVSLQSAPTAVLVSVIFKFGVEVLILIILFKESVSV